MFFPQRETEGKPRPFYKSHSDLFMQALWEGAETGSFRLPQVEGIENTKLEGRGQGREFYLLALGG